MGLSALESDHSSLLSQHKCTHQALENSASLLVLLSLERSLHCIIVFSQLQSSVCLAQGIMPSQNRVSSAPDGMHACQSLLWVAKRPQQPLSFGRGSIAYFAFSSIIGIGCFCQSCHFSSSLVLVSVYIRLSCVKSSLHEHSVIRDKYLLERFTKTEWIKVCP